MTVPAPAATPAAPAAPAPAAPAPASGGMFDDVAITEPTRAPEPPMDAPLADPLAPQETQQPEAPKPSEEQQPGDEPNPEATKPPAGQDPVAAAPPKKWAERFDRPEDLEVAYVQSSKEGRRLAGVVKERDAALEAAQGKIQQLEDQLSLGNELKELSQDEMANMTPQAVAQHEIKRAEQQRLKRELAQRRESEAKQSKEKAEAVTREIHGLVAQMREKVADFKDLEPIMDQMIDSWPEIAGSVNSPKILLWAARGWKAAQKEQAAQQAKAKAEAQAKAKAAAEAQAAGGSGAPGSTKTPAGTERQIDPDSDEAWNRKLLQGSGKAPIFG